MLPAKTSPGGATMRKLFVLLLMAALTCLPVSAQSAPKAKSPSAKPAGAGRIPDRALAQKIWDAWSTMNPDNAARYYDKSATNLFFDIAPLKYDGWTQYADGVRKLLADYESVKLTLDPDVQFHPLANLVWADGTGTLSYSMKNGTKGKLPLRWTGVWEKRGGQWLMIHEHTSVPLPEPEKK
jgi:ketosteroid isomerase-like protein